MWFLSFRLPLPNIFDTHLKLDIMKKILFAVIAMVTLCPCIHAQKKLSGEEMEKIANLMETDWHFTSTYILWLENENRLNHYLSTLEGRCIDDISSVLEMSEEWYKNNQRVLQLESQIYTKPGTKKSEANLARYFKDTEKAKKLFAQAHVNEQMYNRLVLQSTAVIKRKQKEVFTVPQGALTYFYFRQGGGMVHRPPLQSTLERQKDGTYTVELDTKDFERLDTITLTQAQVDTIRQMLIDGEVYKMPLYHDEPVLLLDAPSSSVSVKFTDASFHCNAYPPMKWGGAKIWDVYRYLKGLQPKDEETEK